MTIEDLLNTVHVKPHDLKLLERAFVHRSFINENPRTHKEHNERLEFLGDAILELITTEFLFSRFPHHAEGDLTAYRSALVNTSMLGAVAETLGFNMLLKLSKGEAKGDSKARLSILADAYEAFLGALYLDQGYAVTKSVVEKTLLRHIDEVIEKQMYKDPKSHVQEKAQDVYGVTPSYTMIEEIGPDHDKRFVMGIYFGKDKIAEGEGKSKQEAETTAARKAIEKLKW